MSNPTDAIAKQEAVVADLNKRIASIQAMLAKGQQDLRETAAGILHANGKLEGMKEMLGLMEGKHGC